MNIKQQFKEGLITNNPVSYTHLADDHGDHALRAGERGLGDVAGLLAAGGGGAELGDGAVVLKIGLLGVFVGREDAVSYTHLACVSGG